VGSKANGRKQVGLSKIEKGVGNAQGGVERGEKARRGFGREARLGGGEKGVGIKGRAIVWKRCEGSEGKLAECKGSTCSKKKKGKSGGIREKGGSQGSNKECQCQRASDP